VIIPVDFGGFPCDYLEINSLPVKYKKIFSANSAEQEKLGRILILSDSAHSFGATYNGQKAGVLTDVSIFSFQAVKNLTTSEGGAVSLNLPKPFNNAEVYKHLYVKTSHGQNKDALSKTQKSTWRYDIVEAGYKFNMTDIAAAMGLIELERYERDTLVKRKAIFQTYNESFMNKNWAIISSAISDVKETSYHLYPLRIKGINEKQRDKIIEIIFNNNVAVNVHFIPVPMFSYYKKLGYDIVNYPVAYKNYSQEISLPIFYNLSKDQQTIVIETVIFAVEEVLLNY